MSSPSLRVRFRAAAEDGSDELQLAIRTEWTPERAAVVICDMWDTHHCVSAASRVGEMAPHVNKVVTGMRQMGALIIHCPSRCMDFYGGHPARKRATEARQVDAQVAFDWNTWTPSEESALPRTITDPGPCSCHAAEPCCDLNDPTPWTRQVDSIEIDPEDAISEDGQEVFNLLEHRGINDVVVTGVHTNICVLSQPFGLRQFVYLNKSPLLCRDLTDSFHRDTGGHGAGTELVVAHIERHWCPSITSDQLVGGTAFSFAGDEQRV
jgi:nicotinamidase-related amidase